jgi:hypothetical protein
MNNRTNKSAEIGTELTPEQLEYVSGGSPFLPGPLELLEFLGSAANDVGHLVGHALGTAANDVGHAVASAGKKVANFFNSLF